MCRNDPRATCATCRWYDPEEVGHVKGVCSFHPPVALPVKEAGYGKYPGVMPHWWCSHHEYHLARPVPPEDATLSCDQCGGMGEVYPQFRNEPVPCLSCGGTGAVRVVADD